MEDEYLDDNFKSQLDAEGLLIMHLNRVAVLRDTDVRKYCSSVETLILVCPRHIRDRALKHMEEIGLPRGKYSSITEDKLVVYDDLLVYVNEQLEKQRMIWKKRQVKTYE